MLSSMYLAVVFAVLSVSPEVSKDATLKPAVLRESPLESLEKLGIDAEKKADGSWEVTFPDEIEIGDGFVEGVMGTKKEPGPLRELGKVTSLTLRFSKVTSKGIALVSELGSIEELILCGTRVDAEGMAAIAKLQKLKFIMPGLYITDAALKPLANHPTLEALDLQTSSVTDAGVDTIVTLKKLEYLNISGQEIRAPGLKKLGQIATLQALHMRSAGLADADLAGLSGIKSLRELYLDFNDKITGAGFEHVTGLDSLEVLGIYQVPFEGANLKHLTRFVKLKKLHLFGIQHRFVLADFFVLREMPELRHVVVGESRQDKQAEAKFATLLPKVELKFLGE